MGAVSRHWQLALRRVRRALRSSIVAALLVFCLALLAILAAREHGWLQRPETLLYDRFLHWRPHTPEPDDRIVIVGMSEDDVVKYGHPLSDESLAALLGKIAAFQPAAIGLDLYRDLPEPRSGSERTALDAVLRQHASIIAIRRVPGIGPPPALADRPGQIAANNFPKDAAIDGVVRRGYLRVRHSGVDAPSLAWALAAAWLRARGIEAEFDEGAPRMGRTTFLPLTPHAAWYRGVPLGGDEFLLDFRGPRDFLLAPVDTVLSDGLTDEDLRGKIVLIGTVTESVKDADATPMAESHRGVFLHATMVNQLLRAALDGQRPLGWWSEGAEIAWIALWTAIGTALGFTQYSPSRLALTLGLSLATIGLCAWASFEGGAWLPLAAPAIPLVGSAALATSCVAFLEREARSVMRSLFSKHVSRSVAEALWVRRDELIEGERLRPQKAIATVLFTDLKDFTTTSEKMEPENLLAWMNEYMSAIAHHVEERGGMINRFMGDAIMGVFGAPFLRTTEAEIDTDAINAVECALAMERTLFALNTAWTARRLPTTSMRIGIFTGPVVTGSLGTADRLEYTVFGDSVNIAARLESAGKEESGPDLPQSPCTILIGDSTFQRLHGRYRTILRGPIPLKGKVEKVIVHRLLGPVAPDTPL